MKAAETVFLVFVLGFVTPVGSYGQPVRRDVPKLPGATLLLGYGPQNLALMDQRGTVVLQPKDGEPSSWGHMILVSISRDGELVASVKLKAPEKEALSVYSTSDGKWTEYLEAQSIWSAAISPDKGRIAFVGAEGGGPVRLRLLNLRTRQVEALLDSPVSIYGAPTWSPDGRQLAYQVDLPPSDPTRNQRNFAVEVIELETGKTRRVANGQNPAWSPKGDWIAYLDMSGDPGGGTSCMAVRPDGTDTKVLTTSPRRFFGGHRVFVWAPVWSPDGGKLLLNVVADWEEWKMNIFLLDLSTHKLKRIRGSGVAVLGWAESK